MKNEKLEFLLKEYDGKEKFKELNRATQYLLRFYYNSKSVENITKDLIVDDIVWEEDFEDFIKVLKENDVKEIVFASTWSSSIKLLMCLLDNGYKVVGSKIYKNHRTCFGGNEIMKGIELIGE